DLGERLGTVGHLSALRRTASGPFEVTECVSGEDLRAAASDAERREPIHQRLVSLEEATRFMATLEVDDDGRADAMHGRPIAPDRFRVVTAATKAGEAVRVVDP